MLACIKYNVYNVWVVIEVYKVFIVITKLTKKLSKIVDVCIDFVQTWFLRETMIWKLNQLGFYLVATLQ